MTHQPNVKHITTNILILYWNFKASQHRISTLHLSLTLLCKRRQIIDMLTV